MLGGLFKSGWQNNSAEKRHLAIQKMSASDDSNQAIFEQLALKDSSLQVRLACIERISDAAVLFKVYQQQTDDTAVTAARSAFCDAIGINSKLSEADLNALLARHKDAHILVAQHCLYPSLRIELFDKMSQADQANVIAGVAYAETRLHIAQQLDQVDALETVRRLLKGKDKKAEKVVRRKLEEYRSQQKITNEVNTAAEVLCEKMEFIANHPEWRAEFKLKYQQYCQRWDTLELEPEATVSSRFNSAEKVATAKVEHQTKRENAEISQTQITKKLERYCEKLAPLSLTELENERLSINTVLGEALATWLENTDIVPAAPSLSNAFLSAQQALSSLSDLLETISNGASDQIDVRQLASDLENLCWQQSYSNLVAEKQASTFLTELRQQNSDQLKQSKDKLDALHKRISRLLSTSNKGDIRKAKHELAATIKAASDYSGKERKVLDERLEMAAEIVSKMSDWQNFATEPKLVALCESMERLVNSTIHPDKLARQISSLQSNWKSLGHTDIAEDYWQRFKTAADLAFAPCALFFEQRNAIRKENLSKREPLLEKMQSLLDDTEWGESPDYKLVESQLRDINNQWRKVKDVERNAGQKQWNKLNVIKDAIYQKLDLVYDANIEQKNHLIKQVNSLAEGSINDDSLEKLKLFQSRWKQVGITRRKQDQEAWKRFRVAGDNLYDKVKELRSEKRAHEDQQIAGYKDIIEKIHALAKSATNLADADAQFSQLSDDYEALPPLPKALPEKLVERLNNDFIRAAEAYSRAHERIIQTSKDEVVQRLAEKAQLCTELEIAVANNDEVLASELEQKIADIAIGDGSLEKYFKNRLRAVREKDKSAAGHARKLLCIDLEIMLDIASPEQDKALRMQIQLERMKKAGIGHTPVEQGKALKQLKLDWLCLAGAEPDLQATLEKRFNALMSKS